MALILAALDLRSNCGIGVQYNDSSEHAAGRLLPGKHSSFSCSESDHDEKPDKAQYHGAKHRRLSNLVGTSHIAHSVVEQTQAAISPLRRITCLYNFGLVINATSVVIFYLCDIGL